MNLCFGSERILKRNLFEGMRGRESFKGLQER